MVVEVTAGGRVVCTVAGPSDRWSMLISKTDVARPVSVKAYPFNTATIWDPPLSLGTYTVPAAPLSTEGIERSSRKSN